MLGLEESLLNRIAKSIYWGALLSKSSFLIPVLVCDRKVRMLVALAGQLIGFPRHLSQHVSGLSSGVPDASGPY